VRESKIRKLGKLEAYPTSVLASISAGSRGGLFRFAMQS